MNLATQTHFYVVGNRSDFLHITASLASRALCGHRPPGAEGAWPRSTGAGTLRLCQRCSAQAVKQGAVVGF